MGEYYVLTILIAIKKKKKKLYYSSEKFERDTCAVMIVITDQRRVIGN